MLILLCKATRSSFPGFFAPSPVCGYLDCRKKIQHRVPSPLDRGIMFETFSQECVKSVSVEGGWRSVQKSQALCLRDQVNMIKYIQYDFYR